MIKQIICRFYLLAIAVNAAKHVAISYTLRANSRTENAKM
jgi:hypothetical protein